MKVKISQIRRGSLVRCGTFGILEVTHVDKSNQFNPTNKLTMLDGTTLIVEDDELIERVKY